nr:N-acetyllactosaminide beta-1,3-N-acetylglucosaminyltransferase 2 [Ciona intestinalis]|eukprot:XP_002121312.1 N-acetyllactosaminide beta-1,3-N-acetylglucosaminyltransferase 2 [Ciona intestinalis]
MILDLVPLRRIVTNYENENCMKMSTPRFFRIPKYYRTLVLVVLFMCCLAIVRMNVNYNNHREMLCRARTFYSTSHYYPAAEVQKPPESAATATLITYDDIVKASSSNGGYFLKEPTVLRKQRCIVEACTDGGRMHTKNVTWTMVSFIKSKANSSNYRDILRRSWAATTYVDGGRFFYIFVVGKSENKSVEHDLVKEHERYGDILQYNGPDDYRNIALKTLAGMKWADVNLPNSFLYTSMDDDFLVDMARLKNAIDNGIGLKPKSNWTELPMMCMYVKGSGEKPVRDLYGEYGKYFIDENTFKWHVLPVYCHGGMYIMSTTIMKQLLAASRDQEPLYLDDVWITGILRNKIGMPDEMVLAPEKGVTTHFLGFKGDKEHKKVTVTDYIKQWNEIIEGYTHVSMCQCFKT